MTQLDLQCDDFVVTVAFADDTEARLLLEAQHRGQPLRGAYSVVQHSDHVPQGQHHVHVYKRQNQVFALNRDGTGHDGHHGYPIPNKVAAALRQVFPGWRIPSDNIIECMGRAQFLVETLTA